MVALAVGFASRLAASEGFSVIFNEDSLEGDFDPSLERPHREPGFERRPHDEGIGLHAEAQDSFDRSLLTAALAIGIVTLLVTLLLSRWIVGPVERITEQARRLGKGELDPTAHNTRSDELGVLGRTMTQLAEDLKRTEGLREDLVHDVAHELRTPLTALQGQVEALQDGLLDPNAQTLGLLHGNVLQLARIVEDLQQLAQAEAGLLTLEFGEVSLDTEVQALVSSLLASETATEIDVQLEDLPTVRADAVRVRQILDNLLSNALRFTPSDRPVLVRGKAHKDHVELTVHNFGHGLSPQDCERVFERFYRVDPSRQRGTGGVGLGLPIARRLAEAQGGGLQLASTDGVTATVRLPRWIG